MTKVRVIAEAGVNHNGDVARALRLVEVAAEAGANTVKFQSFRTEQLVSRSAPKADYQKRTTGATASQFDMLKALELSATAHEQVRDHCVECGIGFLSTPFDLESLRYLVKELKVNELKIASGDLTNAPLLLEAARSDLPLILSTGMSTLGEIETALGVIAFGYIKAGDKPSVNAFQSAFGSTQGQASLRDKVLLMHCASDYPAAFADLNLHAIGSLERLFGLRIGYSDHSLGITAPVVACALGAIAIEKHFTLDRNLPGPDHAASLEPQELKQLVTALTETMESLGTPRKFPTASEWKNKHVMQKSVVAARPIRRGELLSVENLTTKRPGGGIAPIHYWELLGRIATADFSPDEMIRL